MKTFRILRMDWKRVGRADDYVPASTRIVSDVADAVVRNAYWSFSLDAAEPYVIPCLKIGDCVLHTETGEGWIVTGTFAGRPNLLGVPKNALALN